MLRFHRNYSLIYRACFFMIAICASGCVPVKFVDLGGDKTTDIGFEYYASKSYLLVESTKEGKKARIITFPDVTKRRSVKYLPIWGSAEVGFKVENGVITEFNNKYDAKGPETITALTGAAGALLSSGAAAESSGIADKILEAALPSVFGTTNMTDPAINSFWAGATKSIQAYTFPELVSTITILDDDVLSELEKMKTDEPFKSIHSRIELQRSKLASLKDVTFTTPDQLKIHILKVIKEGRKVWSILNAEQVLLQQIAENPKVYPKGASIAARAISGLKSAKSKLGALVKPGGPTLRLYELVPTKAGEMHFRPVFLE